MASRQSIMPKGLLQARRRAHRFLRPQVSSNSAARPPPPSNSLLGLPAEIKRIILSSLSDVASLEALISTCSSLYYSFLDSESSILAKILVNQITPDLMRDAFAVWESTKKDPGGIHADEYLSLLLNGDEMPFSALPKWGLRDALFLSKTHEHVLFWANRFASCALSHHPVTCKPETNPTPISPSEWNRIERSLYRFQFYCNLYALRKNGCTNHLETISTSFHGFAPWENEQLISIREYLGEALLESFDNLAEHGVERAARKARFGRDWSKVHPGDCLPLGLGFLRQLVLAKTHKKLSHLLSKQPLGCEGFFDTPLTGDALDHVPLSRLTGAEQRKLIHGQVACDYDTGPRDAWRWAHANCRPTRWCNDDQRDDLRTMGYVMWDSARLKDWGILDRDWRKLPRRKEDARVVGKFATAMRDPDLALQALFGRI